MEDYSAGLDFLSTHPLVDMIVGSNATSTYFSEDAYNRAAEPKELFFEVRRPCSALILVLAGPPGHVRTALSAQVVERPRRRVRGGVQGS